jgi:hypothetical protein
MEPMYSLSEESLKKLETAIDYFYHPMVLYSDDFEAMRKQADEKREMAMDIVRDLVMSYRLPQVQKP